MFRRVDLHSLVRAFNWRSIGNRNTLRIQGVVSDLVEIIPVPLCSWTACYKRCEPNGAGVFSTDVRIIQLRYTPLQHFFLYQRTNSTGNYKWLSQYLSIRMVSRNTSIEDDGGFGPSLSRRMVLSLIGLSAVNADVTSANTDSMKESSKPNSDPNMDESSGAEIFIDEVLPGDKFGKVRVDDFTHTL